MSDANDPEGERWINLTTATVVSGLSSGTLRRLADAQAITATRTEGGHRRFLLSSLRKYMAQRSTSPS